MMSFTLLLPFLAFSCFPLVNAAFRLALYVGALVSAYGLTLWFTGTGFAWGNEVVRADVLFGTPNTFASFINLFLAPLLAYYLMGKGGRWVFTLLLLLFTTLLATQSRGGYLGLMASMAFFGAFAGIRVLRSNFRSFGQVLAGFTASALLLQWLSHSGKVGWEGGDRLLATSMQADNSRIELFTVAWQTLKEHFPGGTGTFTFKYYLEMFKPLSWQDRHTSFVHNDYLQLAVENGLAGISTFLLMVAALYFYMFKYRHRVVDEQQLPMIMSATAATSIFGHALVDFPLYVPFFQAFLGAGLGVVNKQLMETGVKCYEIPDIARWKLPGFSSAFIRNITALIFAGWLGLPFFAKAAADFGLIWLRNGNTQEGVYWHGIARALQPSSAEFYWREGVIWCDLGISRHDPAFVKKGDALLGKADELNPLESQFLMYRIALHSRNPELFQSLASKDELMKWMLRAKKLQPIGVAIQADYIRLLSSYGQRREAVEQAEILLKWKPTARFAKKLLGDVKAIPENHVNNH